MAVFDMSNIGSVIKNVRSLAFVACFSLVLSIHSQAGDPEQRSAYLDTSLPVQERVDDLLRRMTLEEKVSQLVNQSRAIPRLRIAQYDWWSEALHGVCGPGFATVFPEPIGLAATFDTSLVHDIAAAIGTEGRARHNMAVRAGRRDLLEGLDFWAPNINIFRDPRWGRGQETYGEDPFLTSRLAVAFVTGMQGDDPTYLRAIATPKHFAVHSGPEPSRHTLDVSVSKHDLEDTYLPAFRAAVTEGKAGSVMCAYNSVNGVPACANSVLLDDYLRRKWRFTGYVVSDCDAIDEILSEHHYTKNIAEAAALSLKAGVDNECVDSYAPATDSSDYAKYKDAVKKGLATEADIDTAVRRLLTARFRLGEFDPPASVKYAQISDSENDSSAHRELALTAARESIVLLKNDGALPINSNVKRIAVVGSLADSLKVLNGNYNGTPSHPVNILEGIRAEFAHATIRFEPGVNFQREEVLVPGGAFTTDGGRPGLKAEYFSNERLEGSPILLRIDNRPNLEALPAGKDSLVQPEGLKEFSVRWTGFLAATETGEFQLEPTGYTNKLWLDEKVIIDNSFDNREGARIATVKLEKGHRYRFKLECAVQDDLGARLLWNHLLDNPLASAISAARDAEVVIAVVGITSQLEGEELRVNQPGFKGGDRTSLDLPQEEEDLLKAMVATGKPLVVVLTNGSALAMNWASQHADAILDAWYPGEEGGTAVAQTLSGKNNPAGRLPVTFYRSAAQLPAFDDYSMRNRTYRYFTGTPLYPFGFGLSYSSFVYTNLQLSSSSLHAGDDLVVEADVTNTSRRGGDEVAELFLRFPPVPGAPKLALRAFQRVHLAAGEKQHLRFNLTDYDLSMVSDDGHRMIAPGRYAVSVGGGQSGAHSALAEGSFFVVGTKELDD
jgi:beta-glucosidase